MIGIIQRVLDRLREDIDDPALIDVLEESEYEPSTDDDDDDGSLDAPPPPELDTFVLRRAQLDSMAEDCAICLEPFRLRQHACRLACSHVYHKSCIRAWIEHDAQNRCPTCRADAVTLKPEVRRSARAAALREMPRLPHGLAPPRS